MHRRFHGLSRPCSRTGDARYARYRKTAVLSTVTSGSVRKLIRHQSRAVFVTLPPPQIKPVCVSVNVQHSYCSTWPNFCTEIHKLRTHKLSISRITLHSTNFSMEYFLDSGGGVGLPWYTSIVSSSHPHRDRLAAPQSPSPPPPPRRRIGNSAVRFSIRLDYVRFVCQIDYDRLISKNTDVRFIFFTKARFVDFLTEDMHKLTVDSIRPVFEHRM